MGRDIPPPRGKASVAVRRSRDRGDARPSDRLLPAGPRGASQDGAGTTGSLPSWRLRTPLPAATPATGTPPPPIRQRALGELSPSSRAFIAAARSAGLARTDAFHGDVADGAGGYPLKAALIPSARCRSSAAVLRNDISRDPCRMSVDRPATTSRICGEGLHWRCTATT